MRFTACLNCSRNSLSYFEGLQFAWSISMACAMRGEHERRHFALGGASRNWLQGTLEDVCDAARNKIRAGVMHHMACTVHHI